MADTKISALTELAVTPDSADEFVVVDKDVTTMAASGTDKRIKWSTVAGAFVASTLPDAKGDILTATADNTPARKAVGANGESLSADSSQTDGLKWEQRVQAGTLASRPAASAVLPGTLYSATDALLVYRSDGSSTWTALSLGPGVGSQIGLGWIFGAKGQLLVGTASTGASLVTVGSNNQVLVADSAQSAGVKWAYAPYVLASSGAQVADKGNVTTAQNFAAITLTGGVLGANGMLEVHSFWSASGSGTKTHEIRLGSSPFRYRQTTTSTRIRQIGYFQNRNSQSAQYIGSNTIQPDGIDTNTTSDLAVNTATDQTINIVGTKATGTDTLALENYMVRVFPAA